MHRSLPIIAYALLWFGFTETASTAAPLADTLLPNTTRGVVSIANFEEVSARFDQTLLGQLLADPAMEPFVEDLRQQLRDKFAETYNRLGLTWEELKTVPAREVSMGIVHAKSAPPAVVLLVDVTGHEAEAQRLLTDIHKRFTAQRAKAARRDLAGTAMMVYELPPPKGERQPQRTALWLKGNVLIAADQSTVVEDIVKRIGGRPAADCLGALPAFRAVMERCSAEAGPDAPHVRWWIEPFGLATAMRARRPDDDISARNAERQRNALKVGFGALQGAGGFVQVATERYDFLLRTAIYAPKPWEKSMNMLAFPNAAPVAPPAWVPRDVGTYVSLSVDAKKAEANFEPLFDSMFGEGDEGVWTEVKESLRDDPNGPRIDLENDLVNQLGQRVTAIIDYHMPITPSSERVCVAIDTTNERVVADTIRRSMETDPNVKLRDVGGFQVWEMIEEQLDLPEVEIDGEPATSGGGGGADLGDNSDRLLPRSAIVVAHGHLFIASHTDFLEHLLLPRSPGDTLSTSPDFRLIDDEMKRLGASQNSFRGYIRQNRSQRVTYELTRMNRMPEAKNMLGGLMNTLLGAQEGMLREAQLDGRKLPEFEKVEHYFGPAGMFVTTEDNGWFAVTFAVNKQVLTARDPKIGTRPNSVRLR
ncbi:MAG: hypothetical protein AB7U73_06145 [Pirellulales bacterium]